MLIAAVIALQTVTQMPDGRIFISAPDIRGMMAQTVSDGNAAIQMSIDEINDSRRRKNGDVAFANSQIEFLEQEQVNLRALELEQAEAERPDEIHRILLQYAR